MSPPASQALRQIFMNINGPGDHFQYLLHALLVNQSWFKVVAGTDTSHMVAAASGVFLITPTGEYLIKRELTSVFFTHHPTPKCLLPPSSAQSSRAEPFAGYRSCQTPFTQRGRLCREEPAPLQMSRRCCRDETVTVNQFRSALFCVRVNLTT